MAIIIASLTVSEEPGECFLESNFSSNMSYAVGDTSFRFKIGYYHRHSYIKSVSWTYPFFHLKVFHVDTLPIIMLVGVLVPCSTQQLYYIITALNQTQLNTCPIGSGVPTGDHDGDADRIPNSTIINQTKLFQLLH